MRVGFFVFLALVIALELYALFRVLGVLGLRPSHKRLAAAIALVVLLGPSVMRLGDSGPEAASLTSLALPGFALGLTLTFTLAFLVPFDLVALARRLGNGWTRRASPGNDAPAASSFDGTPLTPSQRNDLVSPDASAAAEPASAEPASAEPAAAPTPSIADESSAPSEPLVVAPEPPTLGRRELLTRAYAGLAVGSSATASLYGLAIGRHDYVVEQVPIPLRNLPRELDGYTIAQLSDVHVGAWVGDREFDAGVELVRSARPDLVVLTGDLVDHDIRYAPVLGRFVRRLVELGVRDGVVAIPGNHDYYAGIDEVLRTLRAAGARVLRNQAEVIGDRGGAAFALLGVDDVWAPRAGYGGGPDLPRTLAQVPADLTRVLLCHNPELYPDVADQVDLQLSGHTHGGQVNLVVRPADLVLRHGYVAGHYVRGDSQIYVNRGFGTVGPPARIGAPPEVSRIVLTRV